MATESKGSVIKVKSSNNSNNQAGPSKMKVDSSNSTVKIRKESSLKQTPSDSKHKTVSKSEAKSKVAASPSTPAKTTTKGREKKVFSLPGQKYDPPEEREPLRIFYESLSKQIPTSEMAEFWMMEHGLLSPERAKKAYEKKQKKQKMQRLGTPIKSPKPVSKPESSQKQQQASKNGETKVKKRIINDIDDDEFVFSPRRRKA